MLGGTSKLTEYLLNTNPGIAAATVVASAWRVTGEDMQGLTDNESTSLVIETVLRYMHKGGPETRDNERERPLAFIAAALLDAGANPKFLYDLELSDLLPKDPSALKGRFKNQASCKRVLAAVVSEVAKKGYDQKAAGEMVAKFLDEKDITLGDIIRQSRARLARKARRQKINA